MQSNTTTSDANIFIYWAQEAMHNEDKWVNTLYNDGPEKWPHV